jgi:sigma-B regulation protein RsbU (phosphoserine phosphatase)
MDYLEVVDGAGRRRRIELDRPRLLIGREPTCDICLPHPGVSRRHAQLQANDQGRWLLQDLSSRNHVYVANKPVKQLVLEPRKPFRIAEYTLHLDLSATIPEAEAASVPAEDADASLPPDPAWLEQLQVFQRGLSRVDDPRAILDRLAHEIDNLLGPRLLAIGVSKAEGYAWELVLSDGAGDQGSLSLAEVDRRITEESASSMQSWSVDSPKLAGSAAPGKVGAEPGSSLSLLLPMKGRATVVGHVYIQGPRLNPVPKPLLRYMSVLAALTGLMWDNLQLAALRLSQIELEKELQQARQIQIDLFPETFDIDQRLDIFAVNLPSAHVSGDYYDLIRTGPDSVAFVIADAMGHGMPAALLMAAVRAALHMGLSLGLAWPLIFKGLDEVITRARGEMFVTGIVGLLDLAKQELQMVCAGHPLPSILVDGHAVLVPEICRTRPWGLELPVGWDVGRINLTGKEWSILCYTDGITDAAARTQRTYGALRVASYHAQRHRLSAEDLCQGLLSHIAVQPGPRSLDDDQTVLVLCSGRAKD